ncbi:unnamed protein product [Sphenostylis stenocarpa]|uniref:Late embryogenesis abundant protein n=1 Tax=Sphenostylis stenocarpa TaxID=92480 RepID=A0AA86SY57_9FABA|nr:unnamed protein product [Sphenostylis stenocarpa]
MAEAQLRDQHGNPVVLTDEHGNPVHLTGVATTVTPAATAGSGFGTYGASAHGGGATTDTATVADLIATQPRDTRELRRSSSSSSSSSEDDGQGGRRKKGVKDKIKEKVPGRKNMEQHSPPTTTTTSTTTAVTGVPHPTPPPTATDPNPNHPQKKGIMEKIKEKLPGHHNH